MFLKTFKAKILAASLGMTIISVAIFGYGLASIYYHHMHQSLSRSLSFLISEVMFEHRPNEITTDTISDVIHSHHLQIFSQNDLIHDLQIEILPSPPKEKSQRISQFVQLPDHRYLSISSSTSHINTVLFTMLMNQWIFFILGFIFTSSLIYISIRRLFAPFNQLVDHCLTCDDPDQKPATVTGGVEIIALRNAIASLQERISRLQSAQRDLMKGLTHELKTPLAQLRLRIDLADQNGEWNSDSIRDSRDEIDSITHKITQILHSTQHRETVESITVKRSIENIKVSLAPLWKHRQLNIIIDIDESILLTLPKRPYERIIRIAIENALNHSCHGSNIKIYFQQDVLEIENPTCGQNIPIICSTGKGLEIAQTLCDHYGWELKDQQTTQSYKLSLKFQPYNTNSING